MSPCVSVRDKDVALTAFEIINIKSIFGNIDCFYFDNLVLLALLRFQRLAYYSLLFIYFSAFEFVHEVIIQFIIALDFCYLWMLKKNRNYFKY